MVAFAGRATSFAKLQRRLGVRNPGQELRRAVPVYFYLFDVLRADGTDVRHPPLRERSLGDPGGGPAMTREKLKAGRITVELSNTAKVLFPQDGITKGDLVTYYQAVAGEMLPLLRDRPVSMTRFPDGITSHGIVQKNVPDYFPDWVTRVRVRKEGGSLQQVVCDKPATIVYLANQACIELHAFLSRLDRIDEPDQLIFDLDPPGGDRFGDVRVCALRLRELLTGELGLPAFVKTTGGKGLHIHVPLNAREDFDGVREFARRAAELLAARNPDLITTEQRKDKRGPRIYADIMRNAYAQLAVAPYSVRARPGAPVATPLSWDELDDQGLRPGQFTLRTVPDRIRAADRAGGPWAGLARRRPGLARAHESLRRLAA
ncbi:MAG TPA: non-homologous end-joining DNA ligase [Streptosporangiaceae bacterium]|nr:non-homologous end-joining DNA ligase [Streptosporangiaceae bacterium]